MNVTQQEICTATKWVVVSQPFNQVNVSVIMATAGLRRQTFYDFFRDKYDVLGFIYREEIDHAAAYCRHYEYWPQTLTSILRYFDDNRAFYQRVLSLDVQNAPADVIRRHISTMIADVLTDMGRTEHISVADTYVKFLQSILSEALITALQDWILSRNPASLRDENEWLYHYLQDGFNGLVERQRVEA